MSRTDVPQSELLGILKKRFEENMERHPSITWDFVLSKIKSNQRILKSLFAMESSGGEPDVVVFEPASKHLFFVDCVKESPSGRRSTCYDEEAWESRKKFKPETSAMEMAKKMGVEILDETQYRFLQTLGRYDLKSSSWISTPANIRKLGGALFCDRRYDQVFTYHNGAESYYAARGFRGVLRV